MEDLSLDDLGILSGTDKCSLHHDYLRHYERIFAPFRERSLTLLEIGVFQGGSIATWERYFPQGTIVGVDIKPDCRQYAGGRKIVEIASQADPEAMNGLGTKYQPDLVIDDGSHRADHILIAFEALFPHVRPGGIYTIEDMRGHAGPAAPALRGTSKIGPQQYFLALANRTVCPREEVEVNPAILDLVDTVEFISGIIVIRRKPNPPDLMRSLSLVERTNNPKALLMAAGQLMRVDPERALECARKAAELAPESIRFGRRYAAMMERVGRKQGTKTHLEPAGQAPEAEPGTTAG